jgi:hypothetical protein
MTVPANRIDERHRADHRLRIRPGSGVWSCRRAGNGRTRNLGRWPPARKQLTLLFTDRLRIGKEAIVPLQENTFVDTLKILWIQ